jgi:hypothetical protein
MRVKMCVEMLVLLASRLAISLRLGGTYEEL